MQGCAFYLELIERGIYCSLHAISGEWQLRGNVIWRVVSTKEKSPQLSPVEGFYSV